MQEIVDKVKMITVGPNETLQSYGYSRDQIIETEPATYKSGERLQPLLRVWLMDQEVIEVEKEGCGCQ